MSQSYDEQPDAPVDETGPSTDPFAVTPAETAATEAAAVDEAHADIEAAAASDEAAHEVADVAADVPADEDSAVTDDQAAAGDISDLAEPTEDAPVDPLEEFRETLRNKFGDWFVIHTYSGMENRVKANLESRITSLNM